MTDGRPKDELALLRDAIEFGVEYENSRKMLTHRLDDLLAAHAAELRDRDATIERLRESIRTVARVERERVLSLIEVQSDIDEFLEPRAVNRIKVIVDRIRSASEDPPDNWPLCAVCGKSAREGNHATDLGVGHDYVPIGGPKEASNG